VTYSHDPVRPSELAPLAADVRYEYDMMRACASALVGIYGSGPDAGALRNVLVESLNLHARSLVHFFTTTLPSVRKDDLVAQHYSPDWDPEHDGGVDLAYLQSALVQSVHKRVAHITAYRLRVPKDDDALPVAEILWALVGLMERFLASLSDDQRRWFDLNGQPPDLTFFGFEPTG